MASATMKATSLMDTSSSSPTDGSGGGEGREGRWEGVRGGEVGSERTEEGEGS